MSRPPPDLLQLRGALDDARRRYAKAVAEATRLGQLLQQAREKVQQRAELREEPLPLSVSRKLAWKQLEWEDTVRAFEVELRRCTRERDEVRAQLRVLEEQVLQLQLRATSRSAREHSQLARESVRSLGALARKVAAANQDDDER